MVEFYGEFYPYGSWLRHWATLINVRVLVKQRWRIRVIESHESEKKYAKAQQRFAHILKDSLMWCPCWQGGPVRCALHFYSWSRHGRLWWLWRLLVGISMMHHSNRCSCITMKVHVAGSLAHYTAGDNPVYHPDLNNQWGWSNRSEFRHVLPI